MATDFPPGAPRSPLVVRFLPGRLRRFLLRAGRRVGRNLSADIDSTSSGLTRFARIRLDADVLVYFGDGPSNLYQIDQWLEPLEVLDRSHHVAILTRKPATFAELSARTSLPVVLVKGFADLDGFYSLNRFKVCLYVNNSATNFNALIYGDLLHVHLNHGESVKVSMASNQVKAYDLAFVAGDEAVERYRRALIHLDPQRLIRIGRPQLDRAPGPLPPPSVKPTVLYAPTWEGGRPTMNYTSVGRSGLGVVERLLASGAYRVIYRPHPKTGTEDPAVATANTTIGALIQRAASEHPDVGHRIEPDGPVEALFRAADVLLADVSSVAIDFLTTGKPMVIIDPAGEEAAMPHDSPFSRSAPFLDGSDPQTVVDELDRALRIDPHRSERLAAAERYFGDLTPGAATKRFVEAVGDAIELRDRLVAERELR